MVIIVEVVSFLTQQNLVSENTGNFLATIRLLAKHDVILAEHLQKGKIIQRVSHICPTEVKMK